VSAVVEQIAALFAREGAAAYLGEPVSIAEHMLQTAQQAELAGAPAALIAAALLHDIGHLVHGMAEDAADRGIDTVHEEAGARWLALAFGPEVTEPVRLHVAAKRYLCATDPRYLSQLSPASVHSLGLQGGPLTSAEVAAFAARPHADAAVAVRRWDDGGKIAGRPTPGFDHFRPLLEALAPLGAPHPDLSGT
jgi:gamma-butyrobetaine dioxygenase